MHLASQHRPWYQMRWYLQPPAKPDNQGQGSCPDEVQHPMMYSYRISPVGLSTNLTSSNSWTSSAGTSSSMDKIIMHLYVHGYVKCCLALLNSLLLQHSGLLLMGGQRHLWRSGSLITRHLSSAVSIDVYTSLRQLWKIRQTRLFNCWVLYLHMQIQIYITRWKWSW